MEPDNSYAAQDEDSTMGVPYLTSFLWCMSLKAGCKLISIMHCMFSWAVVLACSIMAHDASQYIGGEEDVDGVYTHAFYLMLFVSSLSVVHILLSGLLLYGVFWRKPLALRMWVTIMVALYLAAVLFLAITTLMCGLGATGSDIFVSFVQALIVFGFIGYCILCVFSYYMMLKNAEEMDRPNKSDYGTD